MRAVRGKAAGGPHHRSPFFTAGNRIIPSCRRHVDDQTARMVFVLGVRLETAKYPARPDRASVPVPEWARASLDAVAL